ncbi:MAG: alpha/beta hydrolase [Propionibacterium sp.]|nr:alpha/beta hydrolase [Propionibacterium sp.]
MPLVPPGARSTHLDLAGGRVRVLRAEPDVHTARPPLLLIHGGGSDNAAISWYRLFEQFGPERAVYAPDLPGFGHTEGIPAPGGPDRQADFVARVAEALGIGRVVVVGVSMGGDIAMNLALRHPHLVDRLVLIGPGGLAPRFGSRTTQFAAWLFAQLPDAALRPLTMLSNRFVAQALKAMVADVDTLPAPVREEFIAEARRNPTSEGYLRYNQATLGRREMRNNLLPQVHRISVPTLFFHGALDPLVNPRGSQVAVRLMPDAELVLVPDCGHWAQVEASERFETELRTFLAAGR